MASSRVTLGSEPMSCRGTSAKPPGFAAPDRCIGLSRVLDAETRQAARASLFADPRSHRRAPQRKRGAKQDDAEIGVLADGALRRLDGAANARSDGQRRRRKRGSRNARARFEIGDVHARIDTSIVDTSIVAEAMHIAWLQRIELRQAGIMEGLGNLLRRRGAGSSALSPLGTRRPEHGIEKRGNDADRRCASASPAASLAKPACC